MSGRPSRKRTFSGRRNWLLRTELLTRGSCPVSRDLLCVSLDRGWPARLAVAEAVRDSFDGAHAAITARCGNVLGKRQLQRLVQAAATDIDAFYAQQTPVPRTCDELLVLSTDGEGIVMRPEALRPATAKAASRATRTFRTRARGWPIATGVIEGACRHLIGDRLDITGARWGLAGAEAILRLRALIANGDLHAYWRFHLDQENHRVHNATTSTCSATADPSVVTPELSGSSRANPQAGHARL